MGKWVSDLAATAVVPLGKESLQRGFRMETADANVE